ncbi:MAG: Gfo/Idh/MocA family oxidoreductase [Leptolyngbya sp. SIO4C1]|nr:Gfo/Idh/MocA family oxidoreductase [Leptolyngbya sp. SIO4C1]
MSKVLRSAVIGTGVISKEHLSFLSQSPMASLVGICDLSPIAAEYNTERYQATSAYTSHKEMLEAAQPDIVHILTPPHTHKRLAMDCLEAGAHVICEKPVATSYEELQEVLAFAQERDRYVIEDHNYRFNEPILAIDRLIQAGTLGNIRDVEVRMALNIREGGRYADPNLPSPAHRLPAGVIHEFITHLCYLTLHFVPDFEKVTAVWSNHGGGDLFKYDDLDALVIGQNTHARIRFSPFTQPDCFFVCVRGDKGQAETDLFQPYLRCVVPRVGGKQLSPLVNHFVGGVGLCGSSIRNFRNKVMQKTPYEGLHRLLGQTYQALAENSSPPISYADMAQVSRLVDALLEENNRA